MSQENAEVLKAAYAAVNRGDFDAWLALIHPEIECRSLIAEAEGRTYRGHDGAREWWATVGQSIGGVQVEAEKIESFRDRGITCLRAVGTVEGVAVPQTLWQAWRVRDGLIIWWDVFRTEAEALEAVGLSE
jgi:ketosteroid isomerase-like protein